MAKSSAVEEPTALQTEVLAVDCDAHEYLESLSLLVPHLAREWRTYIQEWGATQMYVGNRYMVKPSPGRLDWRAPGGGPRGADPALVKRHLFEEQAIGVAILNSLEVSPDYADVLPEFGAAICAAYSDYQIDHWLSQDSRFRGSVYVSLQDPILAAKEIDRVAKHPQIVQVILPLVGNRQYGDPFYRPIYEATVRNGLAIAIHHSAQSPTAIGFPRNWIEWHTNFPQAMISQLTSLLFNGTFDAYPDLKIVCLEAGFTWLPYWMARMDRQYMEFRHTVPWVKRKPSTYIAKHIRLATQPMEELSKQQFMTILDLVGSDEVLVFSTDYPHSDADQVASVLPAGVPDALRTKVLRGNALGTYPRLSGLGPIR